MFQPAIPLSGYSGWKFLQSTYDTQLETYSNSAQVSNDREYLLEKLSEPMELEDFLDDRRLMRIGLTAFDLGGEEWKRGYIDKVLTEAADEDSTFLARLDNVAYTSFAAVFKPNEDGQIDLSEDVLNDVADRYETASFKVAVGEVDDNMRLSLNYETQISKLVKEDSSDETILYRLLGDEPVFKVLQSALNLPSEFTSMDIEQQAKLLKERLSSMLGISDLQDLTNSERIDRVLERFHVMESINNGTVDSSTPGASALTLLGSMGSSASENLFLSTLYGY